MVAHSTAFPVQGQCRHRTPRRSRIIASAILSTLSVAEGAAQGCRQAGHVGDEAMGHHAGGPK